MNLKQLALAAALVSASPLSLHAQVAAAAAAGVTAAAPHIVGALPAILTGTVSSATAHTGQAVLAKLAKPAILSDGTKLPAGSQLLGKITQATPLSGGSKGTSSLGMIFDHVKSPDGQSRELTGVLQGVGSGAHGRQSAPPPQQQSSGSGSGGGLLGGVTGAVGNTVSGVVGATGQLLGVVTGLPGVLLDSNGNLVAQGKNVDLSSGTQITVGAEASAGASAQ